MRKPRLVGDRKVLLMEDILDERIGRKDATRKRTSKKMIRPF
jgi:hypoxanthine-guanine phosphoribosyltransferase